MTCNKLTVVTRHILSVNWDDLPEDGRWRLKIAVDDQVIHTYTAWRVTKWFVNIRVTIRWRFSGYVLFSGFQSCVREDFLIFPNIRFFLPLSVVTLNFSVFVVYVVVLAGHVSTSELIFTVTASGSDRTHARTARFLSCSGGRAVRCWVRASIYHVLAAGNRKYKFTAKWWFAVKVNWSTVTTEWSSSNCCSIYRFSEEVFCIHRW